MKQVSLKIFTLLGLVLLVVICFSAKQKSNKKIISFDLYNTVMKQYGDKEVTLEKLKGYMSRHFNNTESLQLINARKAKDGMSTWMGHIFGVVHYEDGTSAIIKISRYTAFFRELHENKVYTIEPPLLDKWHKMVDDFLTEGDLTPADNL